MWVSTPIFGRRLIAPLLVLFLAGAARGQDAAPRDLVGAAGLEAVGYGRSGSDTAAPIAWPPLSACAGRSNTASDSVVLDPVMLDGTVWRDEADLKTGRVVAMAGGVVAAGAVGTYKLAESWYDSPRSGFHFHDFDLDRRVYLQQDKFGHAFSGYYLGHLSSQAYRWAGFSSNQSIWLGGATSFIGLLQIEVMDGFFQNWGFSLLDFGMNAFGSGLAVAQQVDPHTFGGVRLKMSYWPSEAFRDGLYPSYSDTVVDDYEGRIFWLAVNAHGVLPVSVRDAVPAWMRPLGLAVGNGATGIANDVLGGERHVYLALDLDLSRIPVGDSRMLQFIRSQANFIHLPLPGIRFSADGASFGLFF